VAKKLADQISMVLKEFSGHSFTSGKPEGRVRVCTWSLKPLLNLPRLSQMIHADIKQISEYQADILQD